MKTTYWDVEWKQAACINEAKETFFPELGKQFVKTVLEAKAICDTCPIQLKCLEYAVENEDYGIWGGLTAEERKGKVRVYTLPKIERVKRYEDKMVNLTEANHQRSLESASATITKLQHAIEIASSTELPPGAASAMPGWLDAAKLRIDNPTLSMAELADMAGLTKDVYAGKLRRLLKFAGLLSK